MIEFNYRILLVFQTLDGVNYDYWIVSFLLSATIFSMATPPYVKRQDSNSQSPPGDTSVAKKRRKGATRLSCAECRR